MSKDLLSAIARIGGTLAAVRLRRARDGWAADAPESVSLEVSSTETPGAAGDAVGDGGAGKTVSQTEAPVAARRLCAAQPDPTTFCIESGLALFQFLDLPAADADASEIADMVALQLEERKTLPLPAEEMTIATELLEKGAESVRLMACAVPTASLDEILPGIGLAPERIRRIDVAALALSHALPAAGEGRRLRLLDEGGALTALVLDDGRPVLVRTVGPSVAPSPVALRLLRLSLLQAETEQGAVRALAGVDIWAAPPCAAAWADALRDAFGVTPELLAPPAAGASAAAALGAARRSADGSAFDLVPAAWRDARATRAHRRGILRALGFGAVLWAVCALALFLGPSAIDRLAESEKAAAEALNPAVRAVSDVRHRVRLIRSYSDRTFSPLEVLREASLLLPDGITLSSLRYKREDARVVLTATATSTALVYEFKQNVDASPLFRESQLTSGPTTNTRTGGADFELTILLAVPGTGEGDAP